MATISWLQLCEHAFLDSADRLCVIGLTNRFMVPTLPVAVHHLMLAARVVGVRPGDELDVGVSVTTPSGLSPSPGDPECVDVSIAGEYILITLRQFPLGEEGLYRFAISLDNNEPVALEVPVLVMSTATHAPVH